MTEFDEKLKELNIERAMAVYSESVIRESAFLPITLDICGIEVKPFTLMHYVLLDFSRNPLLSGKSEIEAANILEFIWVVSTVFKASDKAAFDTFVKTKCASIDYGKAFEECMQYLEQATLDLDQRNVPDAKGNNKAPYYAWLVPYVDLLANQYGWTVEYITQHLPLNVILQLSRVIEERMSMQSGNKVKFFNKLSDAAAADLMRYLQDKAKEVNKVLVVPEDKE
jgi:hypothetical protein